MAEILEEKLKSLKVSDLLKVIVTNIIGAIIFFYFGLREDLATTVSSILSYLCLWSSYFIWGVGISIFFFSTLILIYVLCEMKIFFIVLAFFLISTLYILPQFLKNKLVQIKAKKERKKYNYEAFQSYFSKKEIQKELCLAIYHFFQEVSVVHNFPVLPTDSLSQIYGISSRNLEEIFSIIEWCDLDSYIRIDDNRLCEAKLDTVEEVVFFLASLKKDLRCETALSE